MSPTEVDMCRNQLKNFLCYRVPTCSTKSKTLPTKPQKTITPDKIALLVAPSRNKSSVRACSKAPVASILNLLRRSVYLLAYVGSARSAGHSLAQVLFGIWQPPEWVGFIPPGEIPEPKRHGARLAKCLSTPKRSPSALTLESFSAYQLPSPGPGFTGERRLHRNAAERLGKRQMTWAS